MVYIVRQINSVRNLPSYSEVHFNIILLLNCLSYNWNIPYTFPNKISLVYANPIFISNSSLTYSLIVGSTGAVIECVMQNKVFILIHLAKNLNALYTVNFVKYVGRNLRYRLSVDLGVTSWNTDKGRIYLEELRKTRINSRTGAIVLSDIYERHASQTSHKSFTTKPNLFVARTT